ncbi:MAG: hypothetical protein ABL996_21275 [Micropepsaceae bacterium]
MNKSISIRDLQKISAKTLDALEEPTPIKAGERTVAAIFPLKKTNLKRLKATLREAERWGKARDVAADDRALEQFGPVDKINWTAAEVRRVQREVTRRK